MVIRATFHSGSLRGRQGVGRTVYLEGHPFANCLREWSVDTLYLETFGRTCRRGPNVRASCRSSRRHQPLPRQPTTCLKQKPILQFEASCLVFHERCHSPQQDHNHSQQVHGGRSNVNVPLRRRHKRWTRTPLRGHTCRDERGGSSNHKERM